MDFKLKSNNDFYYYVSNNNPSVFPSFKIKWYMTRWCNYHCDYCCQNKNTDHRNKFTPEEDLMNTAQHLHNIILKYDISEYILQLIGGEVTYYNITNIMDILYTPGLKTLQITTNFSQKESFFQNLIDWCTEHNVRINLFCSYHSGQTDFDSFFNKAKTISKYLNNNGQLKCTSVASNDSIEYVHRMEDFCNANNIKYVLYHEMTAGKRENNDDLVDFTKCSKHDSTTFIFPDETFHSRTEWKYNYDFADFSDNELWCSGSLSMISVYFDDDSIYAQPCKSKRSVGDLKMETLSFEPVKCDEKCKFCQIHCFINNVDSDKKNLLDFKKKIIPEKIRNLIDVLH